LDIGLKDAQELEEDAFAKVRADLDSTAQTIEREAQSVIQEPTALASLASAGLSEVVAAKAHLVAAAGAIGRDFETALNAYRQANLAVRGPLQPPRYFQFVPQLASEVSTQLADQAAASLLGVQEYCSQVREQLHPRLNDKLEEIRAFRVQTLTTRFDAFRRAIFVEAQAEIDRKFANGNRNGEASLAA
jgi:hypothetical protein